MQRTAALSKIRTMRFTMRPPINLFTALEKSARCCNEVHSRGVEAPANRGLHSCRLGRKDWLIFDLKKFWMSTNQKFDQLIYESFRTRLSRMN
jgi:hypothetical protein